MTNIYIRGLCHKLHHYVISILYFRFRPAIDIDENLCDYNFSCCKKVVAE